MHCLSVAFLFLLLSLCCSCNGTEMETFDKIGIEQDLINLNITCAGEKCEEKKCERYDSYSFYGQNCHCGMKCVQFGTCCLDSKYAAIPQPKLKPACRYVLHGPPYLIVDVEQCQQTPACRYKWNGSPYLLVDQCSSSDSVWTNLCHSEWDGDDDVQKIVPVTSLFTSISYKNYYCFRCHETTDEFIYWNVKLVVDSAQYNISQSDLQDKHISLTYDYITDTWMASYDDHSGFFPVKLSVAVPEKIQELAYVCMKYIISDCSDEWDDEEVRKKCQSYMAMKEVRGNTYKNIHCALCNFESLNDSECRSIVIRGGYGGGGGTTFSFTHLLDINRSDGELVGKIQKCSDDHLWDPYSEKCRKLTCALPGQKIKGGKCVNE